MTPLGRRDGAGRGVESYQHMRLGLDQSQTARYRLAALMNGCGRAASSTTMPAFSGSEAS